MILTPIPDQTREDASQALAHSILEAIEPIIIGRCRQWIEFMDEQFTRKKTQ